MSTGRKRCRDEMRGIIASPKPNWSDLPLDIVERIIGRLGWFDRRSMKGVCKAWSVPNPIIIDKFPWAMSCSRRFGEFRLTYPPLRKGKEFKIFIGARVRALASSYGWVLFESVRSHKFLFKQLAFTNDLFLYSPFTTDLIKLPNSYFEVDVATISLDSTSPKCFIFGLKLEQDKILINICSPGDIAWKTYEFNGFHMAWTTYDIDLSDVVKIKHLIWKTYEVNGVDMHKRVWPQHAAYLGGSFYCVFSGGELGNFNVQLKEWTMLTLGGLPDFDFRSAKLIASEGDLRLLGGKETLELLKFDFSKNQWVRETSLNDRVLFIGCTCLSYPAEGETSQLANHIFSCADGNKSNGQLANNVFSCVGHRDSKLYSRQYKNWALMAADASLWIEFPSTCIWRANDLKTAECLIS